MVVGELSVCSGCALELGLFLSHSMIGWCVYQWFEDADLELEFGIAVVRSDLRGAFRHSHPTHGGVFVSGWWCQWCL